MASEHDVLFGVFAVQSGVLGPARFGALWAEWSSQTGSTLGEWLISTGAISADDRASIDRLVQAALAETPPNPDGQLAAAAEAEVRRALAALDDGDEGPATTTDGPEDDTVPDVDFDPAAGPGDSVRGDFEILSLYASGGIGQVWLARDPRLGRVAALKELRPQYAGDPSARSRFLAEARITGSLTHPGIVPIYEMSRVAPHSALYYAMRFVEGRTLSESVRLFHDRLAKGEVGAVEESALLQAFVQLCNVMAYAHSRGVIHRDLKGQNVVLGEFGEVILLDWGLAKSLEGEGSEKADDTEAAARAVEVWHQTLPGQGLGTPPYMSPEQAEGRIDLVDRRTDVYGLGAILYEILTGRPPYTGETASEVLRRVRAAPPPPPRKVRPAAPRALEAVCLRAMAREPEERYPSALELALDVQRYLVDEPVGAYRGSWAERLARLARRHRTATQAAALSLMAVSVVSLVAAVLVGNARQRERRERLGAERLAAGLLADRGLELCKAGDVGPGLLWLVRGLQQAERAGDDFLPPTIRANLAGWPGELNTLRAYLTHRDRARAVAFSPDGHFLLTASTDATAQLWSADDGQPLGQPFKHREAVYAATFRPDGRAFATAGRDGLARVWDIETRRVLAELPHPDMFWSIAFSPDGRSLLTGCEDKVARLWDVEARRAVELRHGAVVRGVAFHPGGEIVATGGIDNKVRLWHVVRRETTQILDHKGEVMSVAFRPDGRVLASAGKAGGVQLWEAATGRRLGAAGEDLGQLLAVAFSPDGSLLVTGGEDWTARLWDTGSLARFGPPMPHRDPVYTVAFRPDGRTIATGSFDGGVRLWNAIRGKVSPITLVKLPARTLGPEGPPKPVPAVAASPDGSLIAVGYQDGVVRLVEATTGKMLRTLEGFNGSVAALDFSPDGRTVAAGGWDFGPRKGRDGVIRIWDAATGEIRRTLKGRLGAITALDFRPDGAALLTGGSDKARLWDLGTGKELRHFDGHEKSVTSVAFSPDGLMIATGSEDRIARLWRLDAAQPTAPALRIEHQGGVRAVAFSPRDGRLLLTGSRDKTARLWRSDTGAALGPPLAHDDEVMAATFRPDGAAVLTGTSYRWIAPGAALLWDVGTGKRVGPPLLHTGTVHAVAFAGRSVVTGGDDHARVWEPVGEARMETMSAEQLHNWSRVVTGLDMTPDGVLQVLDAAGWQVYRHQFGDPVGR